MVQLPVHYLNTKLLLLLIFFFIPLSHLFSQDFKDYLITLNDDTIHCNVTLKNEHNVFYEYLKRGKLDKSGIISVMQLKSISGIQVENYKVSTDDVPEVFYKQVCDDCFNYVIADEGDTIWIRESTVVHVQKVATTSGLYEFRDIPLAESGSEYIFPPLLNGISYAGVDLIAWIGFVNLRDISDTTVFQTCDVSKVYWKSDFHYRKNAHEKRSGEYNHSSCPTTLARYLIKGSATLMMFARIKDIDRDYNTGLNGFEFTLTEHRRVYEPKYRIEIGSRGYVIPKARQPFISMMTALLKKDPELVRKIKKKELKYEDVPKIIYLYNKTMSSQ